MRPPGQIDAVAGKDVIPEKRGCLGRLADLYTLLVALYALVVLALVLVVWLLPDRFEFLGIVQSVAGILTLLVVVAAAAAAARGATAYAEVAGFGAATSANDPADCNEGLELAIRAALRDARLESGQIDAIIPQSCGVPGIDTPEAGALRRVFGERLRDLPMVVTAPFIGDCSAGNGSLLAAVAAKCLKEQRLPATPAIGHADLARSAAPARDAHIRAMLVCSSAQGGQSAAVVLKTVA